MGQMLATPKATTIAPTSPPAMIPTRPPLNISQGGTPAGRIGRWLEDITIIIAGANYIVRRPATLAPVATPASLPTVETVVAIPAVNLVGFANV